MDDKVKSEYEDGPSTTGEPDTKSAKTIKTLSLTVPVPESAANCPEILKREGYDIKEQIGSGGFSTVFKASGPDPAKPGSKTVMACKVINFAKVPDAWRLGTALNNELKISRNLKHPNVVYVYHIVKTKNNAYIFMELATSTLSGYMDVVKHELSPGRTQLWFGQTMKAMQYMCLKGVAHRDLKTDNLLLVAKDNGQPVVKLADFSFACYVKDRNTKKMKLTTTQCGTTQYKAPEIYSGKPYDPRFADMWSCGIILYEMLTKKNPFPFSDPRFGDKDFIDAAKNKAWKFPKSLEHKIPIEAKDLTYKLLEANPDKRYTASQALAHPFFRPR